MAVATKVPSEDYNIVITLSKSEAESLDLVCGAIGGNPICSRRGDFNTIRNALRRAGVIPLQEKLNGCIYFQDREKR